MCQEWDNMLWCFWNTGIALMQSCHITTWVQSEFLRYLCLNVRILLWWRKGTTQLKELFKQKARHFDLDWLTGALKYYFDAPTVYIDTFPGLLITLRSISSCQISYFSHIKYSDTKFEKKGIYIRKKRQTQNLSLKVWIVWSKNTFTTITTVLQ